MTRSFDAFESWITTPAAAWLKSVGVEEVKLSPEQTEAAQKFFALTQARQDRLLYHLWKFERAIGTPNFEVFQQFIGVSLPSEVETAARLIVELQSGRTDLVQMLRAFSCAVETSAA